jgi:hypothetical protein
MASVWKRIAARDRSIHALAVRAGYFVLYIGHVGGGAK